MGNHEERLVFNVNLYRFHFENLQNLDCQNEENADRKQSA
jgi:hypothetical protein